MSETYQERKARLEKETLDYHGVSEWHSRGFKGDGINFLELEGDTVHCRQVCETFSLIAPDANVFFANDSYSARGDEFTFELTLPDGSKQDLHEFVREHNIHIIAQSISGGSYPSAIDKYLEDTGCVLVCAAGNSDSDGVTGKMDDVAISVGAVQFVDGELRKERYSASGDDELDFACLHGGYEGTSFASPTFAGLVALYMSRYGVKTQDDIFCAFHEFCSQREYDTDFGWGVPILPPDAEQEEPMKHELIMALGRTDYYVDGEQKQTDVPPQILNGRTLVPARMVAEEMGGTVVWNGANKTITITWEDGQPAKK